LPPEGGVLCLAEVGKRGRKGLQKEGLRKKRKERFIYWGGKREVSWLMRFGGTKEEKKGPENIMRQYGSRLQ